jgi:NAD(P)H-dependent FMN reductase
MFAADAFVVVSPEYNGGYSPAIKNLFDHFPKQSHKPFGIATASPGMQGGMRAAQQLFLMTTALWGIPSPQLLIVPEVDKKFDAAGTLTDTAFQKSVDMFVKEYLWLAEALVKK